MNRDDVIRMAMDLGLADDRGACFVNDVGDLHNFARRVAAHEREAIAKMADEYATWGGSNFYDWFKKLAAAIRQRGSAD